MIEDMNSRKLGAHTQRSHIYSCKRFAAFLKRSPDSATLEDIRLFQLHLAETGMSICNRNRIMTGVRFLFRVTLRRLDLAAEIYHLREPQKIPVCVENLVRIDLMGESLNVGPDGRAPRIHGELLKLGFEVAQSTVAKYVARKGDPGGQSWGTFLRNHAPHIAAMDLFVVPTIGFNLLSVLVIVRLARRELVWINVTAHPTAEWIAQQIVEAFPWNEAPRYLIEPWASVISPLCSARRGRIALPSG